MEREAMEFACELLHAPARHFTAWSAIGIDAP
jgi:hypothetical protein